MSRPIRAAAVTAAAAIIAAGMNVVAAPAASAGGCAGDVCGGVNNRTDTTMTITTKISDDEENKSNLPHFCDVWNWYDIPWPEWRHAHCEQESRGTGMYGAYRSGMDIDAFTFVDSGYHERFGRLGAWNWRQAGIWTKFPTGAIADCGIGDNNQIWCTILVQAPIG